MNRLPDKILKITLLVSKLWPFENLDILNVLARYLKNYLI